MGQSLVAKAGGADACGCTACVWSGRLFCGLALREYLRTENERLIYIRGHFEEFTDDAVIRDVLIEVRSEEEYQEMINCLTQEKEQQRAFEEFAREMRTFYDRKTAKIVNKK